MVNTLSLLALVSGATAATFTVQVGQGGQDAFSPSTVTAAVGDIVTFNFNSRHDVVQSTFDSPCNGGTGSDIYSGIMSSGEFSVKINSTDPIWYYCSVNNHCQVGMVGVINPPSGGDSLSSYKSAAASTGSSTAGSGVSGGIVGSNGASLFGESGSSSSASSSAATSSGSAAPSSGSASSAAASSKSAAATSAGSSTKGSSTKTSSTGSTGTSTGSATATSSGAADSIKAFGYAGVAAIAAAIMA